MPHERLTEVGPLHIRRDGAASCRTGDSSLGHVPDAPPPALSDARAAEIDR